MQKYQKYRAAAKRKNESKSIAALQQQLFGQLQNIQNDSYHGRQPDNLFHQFQEEHLVTHQEQRQNQHLLNKAKYLTYSNKAKIEKMKRQIKKIEEGEGDFMTGVGLFEKQTQEVVQEPLDSDFMLRSVPNRKLCDLEELRRMIKKTENNLRTYSHSVYKTQTNVMSAADHCGWDIDVSLAMKINKCNLDQTFRTTTRPLKTKSTINTAENLRRKTSSSYNPRRTKLS